jgi:hypothetical protein
MDAVLVGEEDVLVPVADRLRLGRPSLAEERLHHDVVVREARMNRRRPAHALDTARVENEQHRA